MTTSAYARACRGPRRLCGALLQVERLEERCLLAGGASPGAYGQLPLRFEVNAGQTDAAVRFLARGPGYGLFLTPGEAVLRLQRPSASSTAAQDLAPADVLRLRLVGANPDPAMAGLNELATRSNYFLSNDPSRWRSGVANYARVAYRGVYPGIDLVYYGSQDQLEYDFVVAPGSDPTAIRLSFAGARGLELDGQGNLRLHTAGGDVVEEAPQLYQEGPQGREPVSGRYLLGGDGAVGFAVGAYDLGRPLVIDPILSYGTYLGGSVADEGDGIAVDGTGNAYVTGATSSADFPTAIPLQPAFDGSGDVYVAKLNASGTALVYSTYLGGSDDDGGVGIAVDGTGNAYVTGTTFSADFPTANPLQPASGGSADVFVTKLNASGSALVYSTYLGGSNYDESFGIAVDGTGNAYVTGYTLSTNFPTRNPLQPASGGIQDAFVTKLNASGSALVYSTYLGGSNYDVAYGIAVSSTGNAYVTGYTGSTNFPTRNPLQAASGGSADVFVTKLNASGSALVYSTYLGGSNYEEGFGIAVDGTGNAYVTGSTLSTNFPTRNPLQPALGGVSNAFVTRLNANGSALLYSTYLGGGDHEIGYGIAVDDTGNAYVTGSTSSADFPTANALQPAYGGGGDAFVARLNASGSALVYSTYLGGSSDDRGQYIAVDGTGDAYVTGSTSSADFPTANALQPASGGGTDAFIVKIATAPLSLFGSTLAAVATVPFTAPLAFLVDNRGPTSAGNFTALVAWGDGGSSAATLAPFGGGFIIFADHTYAREGTYTVYVAVLHADGSAARARLTATVADAPLTAVGRTVSGVEAAPLNGVVAFFQDADPRGSAGLYTATIDWGDGTPSPGTVSADGAGFDVLGTHTYATRGTYPLTVTISDPGGAQVVVRGSAVVSYTALVGHALGISVFGNLNFSGSVAGFDDPDPRVNPARYQATMTWPDDGSSSAGTVSGSNPFTVTGSHTFSSFTGTLTLKVVVLDLDTPGRSVTIFSRVADPPGAVMHRAYVGHLYQDLLGRPADDTGLAFWSGLLDQGAATTWVAGQLLASPEYQARQVRDLYATWLHRAPDAPGLSAFTAFLRAGGTLEQAQALLAGSAEYAQQRGGGTADGLMDALYQDALGRPADPSGRAAFVQALSQGLSPRKAASLLFGSVEYRQRQVQGWYLRLLHRDADPAGMGLFADALGSGLTDEAVLAALAGSDEYLRAVGLPAGL